MKSISEDKLHWHELTLTVFNLEIATIVRKLHLSGSRPKSNLNLGSRMSNDRVENLFSKKKNNLEYLKELERDIKS